MTKATMVRKILEDMYKKSDTPAWKIDARWKAWLNRETKTGLELIMKNRGIQ